MSTEPERVYRSDETVVAGVLGGFAEYFDVEPTIFRLAILFLIVATGIVPGLITYLVAILIMPRRPADESSSGSRAKSRPEPGDRPTEGTRPTSGAAEEEAPRRPDSPSE